MPPLFDVEEKLTRVPAQILVVDPAMEIEGGNSGFTIIVTLLLVAVAGVAQTASELRIQEIISPLFSVLSVKLLLFVPTLAPFFFHWYMGVAPPLVITEEKLTGVPAQIVLPDAATEMEGINSGLTIIVMLLLVAVAGTAQVANGVSTQEMISPLFKVLSV